MSRLPPKLAAAMLADPLVRFGSKGKHQLTSVGALASLQGGEGPVRCFMILSLRASPGEDDEDPSGMHSRTADDEEDEDDIDERDIIWDAYLADEKEIEPSRRVLSACGVAKVTRFRGDDLQANMSQDIHIEEVCRNQIQITTN